MLKIGNEFKGLINEQISGLLTPKYIITNLSLGVGIHSNWRNELIKAKVVIVFFNSTGTVFAQDVYYKCVTNNFTFYVGGNSRVNPNNRMLGVYYSINSQGDINISEFDYSGAVITGFATFY